MVKQSGQCHRFILYHKTFSVLVYCLWSVNVICLCQCVAHTVVTHTPHIGVQKCLLPVSICCIVDFGDYLWIIRPIRCLTLQNVLLCNYILLTFNTQYLVPLFPSSGLPLSISSRSRRLLIPSVLLFFQKGNLGRREFRRFFQTNFFVAALGVALQLFWLLILCLKKTIILLVFQAWIVLEQLSYWW